MSEPIPGKPSFSSRALATPPFHVMALLARSQELAAAGRDIVHMEVGEPDFATPSTIVDAGIHALQQGLTHYTPALGLPALRDEIAAWYEHRYGLDVDPRRIVVTPGASGALLLACALLIEQGAEVLLSDPGYPCNANFVRAFGGRSCFLPVGPETGFQPDANQVGAALGPATRALLLASPANPVGTMLSPSQQSAIAMLARERGFWLVSDEIYHGLNYGDPARSMLEFSDDVLVVNSFSKYFGMTGWRLGWLVAPPSAVGVLDRLAQNLFIAASTPSQHAAMAAFAPDTLAELERRRDIFRQRRDALLAALAQTELRVPVIPEGAFYVYARLPDRVADSYAFCQTLLEEHGVAVTPGIDFGSHQAGRYLRFAYTTPVDRLQEGVRRLSVALKAT